MHNTRKVTDQIIWVGASDRRLNRFENLFPLTDGVAYNSYLIVDEKTCLLDTVDQSVSDLYLDNVLHALGGRPLDYLVINHMEPDHCANITTMARLFPDCKLVGNSKTFTFLEQFYDMDLKDRYHVVKEKDELNLGSHTLVFTLAPFVHWPEVMMTYEKTNKILFSADAFGSFKALNGNIFEDEVDFCKDWFSEFRRYYFNIVGKHGKHVQNLFKKLADVDIEMICPLHGPIFRRPEAIKKVMETYQTWSTFTPEEKGVVMVYGSMYGNTEQAIQVLASKLAEKGVKNIKIYDVSNTDVSYIIADMHRYSHAVLGLNNYNMDLYPKMKAFLEECMMTGYGQRTLGLIVNGSWGGKALQQAQDLLTSGPGITVVDPVVNLKSSVKEETLVSLQALADALWA